MGGRDFSLPFESDGRLDVVQFKGDLNETI